MTPRTISGAGGYLANNQQATNVVCVYQQNRVSCTWSRDKGQRAKSVGGAQGLAILRVYSSAAWVVVVDTPPASAEDTVKCYCRASRMCEMRGQ